MIIETHCHLDYLKAAPIDEIIKVSQSVNVGKFITISVSEPNVNKVVEIANQFEPVFCSQGIHPHHAKEVTPNIINLIKSNLKNKKVVAIGEIGLDYYYNHSPKDAQIRAFEEFLEIAINYDLPVIIHSRDAEEDTISVLKNFMPKLKRKGVIHSFSSKKELADYALSENFMLGFNGMITFKKSENIQDIVKLTPVKNILFETDAPFLTPVPHRGKENSPQYLPFIVSKISELKLIDNETLIKQVYQNSIDLFKF